MSVVGFAVAVAELISGVLSLCVILGAVLDAVTRGFVRQRVQSWLGIKDLRSDHQDTQTFIIDLGRSYNKLSETVCNEHNIPENERPGKVDTSYYSARVMEDDNNVEEGDFLRDGGGLDPDKSDEERNA